MRKRSSYRPKTVRTDAITHVLVGIKPLAAVGSELVTIKIRNHDALLSISRGQATRTDIETIIAAMNVAEALTQQRIGDQYMADIKAGQDALASLVRRRNYVGKGAELTAINRAMEVHDAQLDAITVAQLETAICKVAATIRSGGAKAIV